MLRCLDAEIDFGRELILRSFDHFWSCGCVGLVGQFLSLETKVGREKVGGELG